MDYIDTAHGESLLRSQTQSQGPSETNNLGSREGADLHIASSSCLTGCCLQKTPGRCWNPDVCNRAQATTFLFKFSPCVFSYLLPLHSELLPSLSASSAESGAGDSCS